MWRSVETAEGETYYYNEETNETSWENPNDGGEVVAERTDSEVHSDPRCTLGSSAHVRQLPWRPWCPDSSQTTRPWLTSLSALFPL